jgi:hypothetical protein
MCALWLSKKTGGRSGLDVPMREKSGVPTDSSFQKKALAIKKEGHDRHFK